MGTLAYLGQIKLQKQSADLLPTQEKLINYAKVASMRGNRDGAMALGTMYRTGYGSIEKNFDLAETYLTQAAKKGDTRANAGLYLLYANDKVDSEKAQAIKKTIIDGKQTAAISGIAGDYCGTFILFRNKAECFEWAKAGAMAGSVGLSRGYGGLLFAGSGVEENPIEGAAWVVSAKNRGDQLAISLIDKNSSKFTSEQWDQINQRAAEIDKQFVK